MIRNLQALRFVFSFSIFVSHLLGQSLSTFGLGEYGVSGFFILSGFVLSVAYGRKIEEGRFTTRKFFVKQWAKLYPLHIATFILAIFYEAHYGAHYKLVQLIPPVFLLQSWIPVDWFHHIPNGSSWSLCGFFFFYIVFSSIYLIVNRMKPGRLMTLLVVGLALYLAVILCVPESLVYPLVYMSPLMRLPEFILGISLCRFMRSDSGEAAKVWLTRRSVPELTAIEAVVLLAPIVTFLVYGNTNHAIRCVSLFWPFVCAQLLLFSLSDNANGYVTRLLHTPAVMFLGGISFEIYLTHMFVIPIARSVAFKMGLNPVGIVALLLSIAGAFPLAWLAKRYLVEPAFNFLTRDGKVSC